MCRFLREIFSQTRPDPREVIQFDLRDHIPPRTTIGYYDLNAEHADGIRNGLVNALRGASQKNAILEVDFDVVDGSFSSKFMHRVFSTLPAAAHMTPHEIMGVMKLISFETPSYVDECLDYMLNDRWRNAPGPQP